MEIIKSESEFVRFIKDFIVDKLCEFEDCEVYACDFRFDLTHDEEADGDFVKNEREALAFVSKYPKAALATIDYTQSNFGAEELPYVFKDWETFCTRMLTFGVWNVTNSLPCIEENWDDQIVLDEATMDLLIKQVEATDEIIY